MQRFENWTERKYALEDIKVPCCSSCHCDGNQQVSSTLTCDCDCDCMNILVFSGTAWSKHNFSFYSGRTTKSCFFPKCFFFLLILRGQLPSHRCELFSRARHPFCPRTRWPRWLSQLCSHTPVITTRQQTERSTGGHRCSSPTAGQQDSSSPSVTPPLAWEDTDRCRCRLSTFRYFP